MKAIKALAISSMLLAWMMPAQAEVKVSDAWVRITAPGQPVGAGYMTLSSDSDATLVGASTPVAASVELHEMRMQGEVMQMRRLERIALPARQPVTLAPGGLHLMLMQLKHQIVEGEVVPVELQFSDHDGRKFSLQLKLVARSAAPGGQHGSH